MRAEAYGSRPPAGRAGADWAMLTSQPTARAPAAPQSAATPLAPWQRGTADCPPTPLLHAHRRATADPGTRPFELAGELEEQAIATQAARELHPDGPAARDMPSGTDMAGHRSC